MENRFERIEKLLALLLLENLKSKTQAEKMLRLSLAGFTNIEIADLLDTSAAVVSVRLSEARRGVKKGKVKSKGKKQNINK